MFAFTNILSEEMTSQFMNQLWLKDLTSSTGLQSLCLKSTIAVQRTRRTQMMQWFIILIWWCCLLYTSYATSDLATIIQREQDYKPNHYIYVADKRQELHFTQVFRVSKKANIVDENTKMEFLGFGTMNGKDGKPFKTRDGGVMRLEDVYKRQVWKLYL